MYKYTTKGGSEIRIEGGLGYVNGSTIGGVKLIEHPQHGMVLKAYIDTTMVSIPAEHLDGVRAEID